MTISKPLTIDEACRLLHDDPGATVLAGGTDYMVEVNFRHRRPDHVVSLDQVEELRQWRTDHASGTMFIGSTVTIATLENSAIATSIPALAQAARTVGSPQIRAAATLGGNLGTASPAGDTLPVLSALDARVHVASTSGTRSLSVHDYFVGPKRSSLATGELIIGVEVPVSDGPQNFAKVGVRNAMVISIASACFALQNGSVRIALGSVGPTVLRCRDAENYLDERILSGRFDDDATEEFARLVTRASSPIDDHRSTAEYRRHAVRVLARRLARRSIRHVQ